MKAKKQIRNDESGRVAIMVTIIIILFVSLILLNFTRMVRREQRQVLDRQLNTQAFYAAETAINDTVNALRTNANRDVLLSREYMDDCGEFITDAGLTNQLGGASTGVTYSCLFVDPSPPDLRIRDLSTHKSEVLPIKTKSGTNITQLTIRWENDANSTGLASCPAANVMPETWPPSCLIGMVRLDLIPTPGAGMSDDYVVDNAFTAFLHPNAGKPNIAYVDGQGRAKQGIVGGNCDATSCSVTITGLGGFGSSSFYARIKAVYVPSNVTICAPDCTSPEELIEGQVSVDATGRAVDVHRRIQVRMKLYEEGIFPDYAIQSTDTICKRLSIAPPLAPLIDGYSDTECLVN